MKSPSSKEVARRIKDAFAKVESPPPWALVSSYEGDEPRAVETAFLKKQRSWKRLDTKFLDRVPDGLASALSFLSDEAFRFFLPAYLIADVEGKLERVEPVFHLTYGLTKAVHDERLNPRRYGARTWSDAARHRFSVFDKRQARAILAYLRFKQTKDEFDAEMISEARASYWDERAR